MNCIICITDKSETVFKVIDETPDFIFYLKGSQRGEVSRKLIDESIEDKITRFLSCNTPLYFYGSAPDGVKIRVMTVKKELEINRIECDLRRHTREKELIEKKIVDLEKEKEILLKELSEIKGKNELYNLNV